MDRLVRKHRQLRIEVQKNSDEIVDGRQTEKWKDQATPAGGWGNIWYDPKCAL